MGYYIEIEIPSYIEFKTHLTSVEDLDRKLKEIIESYKENKYDYAFAQYYASSFGYKDGSIFFKPEDSYAKHAPKIILDFIARLAAPGEKIKIEFYWSEDGKEWRYEIVGQEGWNELVKVSALVPAKEAHHYMVAREEE